MLRLCNRISQRFFKDINDFLFNSSIAKYPDFKLVPKDQETEFCRWNEIQDFVLSRDAEPKPKYIEIPPLLKLYMARSRRNFQEEVQDDDLLLPAYKIYEGEHRLENRIEPNSISQYLGELSLIFIVY